MISLDAVSKVYHGADGEVRALDSIDLRVARGEFVVVRGPSGCGKSTLLLTIGGMIRPTAGTVAIDGRDLYSLPPAERARLRAERIGFVFQLFHLIPYLSALDNVLVPVLAGMKPDRDEAAAVLERLQMGERLRHRPPELSTGERQRVALARALVKRPEIIFADEPTGNLDPENAAAVMGYLADFHREGGTILVVSHDALTERFADRTVHLDRGRIVAESARS